MNVWDQRFAAEEYVYGTKPNAFLASQASRLPEGGRILALGEGEGRNAVWLAEQGFQVECVDGSTVALEKARALAMTRGVPIWVAPSDLADYWPLVDTYAAVTLIYVHLPPEVRKETHERAQRALAAGGRIILEAFTPAQLGNPSGGPKDPALLYTAEMIRADFPGLEWEVLEEVETELDEGKLHQGKAAVVRAVGRKAG